MSQIIILDFLGQAVFILVTSCLLQNSIKNMAQVNERASEIETGNSNILPLSLEIRN